MSIYEKNRVNILLIIGIFIALKLMDFGQTMTSYWVGPFLSASVNFDWLDWTLYVNWEEIEKFSHLSNSEMFGYRFTQTDNLEEYNYLTKGVVVLFVIAKKIFFWQGSLEALQSLQYIVHISISLFMLSFFPRRYQKILFVVLYTINPIILYFVNYPFYYFWQVVPSVVFLYWYFKPSAVKYRIYLFTPVLVFIYLTRPTVLFLIILFYVLYILKNSYKLGLSSLAIFLILISISPKLSIGPWHTMYVGMGAYSNPYGIELDDNNGYNYYKRATGRDVSSANIMKIEVKEDYYQVLKDRTLEIFKEKPLMMFRNMFYNITQSYSFGYSHSLNQKLNSSMFIYISMAIGITIMSLLLYTKNYLLFLAIGFMGGAFTPYYPPISAYMYGSYILIIVGIISIIDFFIKRRDYEEGK